MIRLLLLFFLASATVCSLATSTVKDDRVIAFSTQDVNGTHFIAIVSDRHTVSVRSGLPGTPHDARYVPYSEERFSAAWKGLQSDGLSSFEIHGDVQNLHIESNFAIVIMTAGTTRLFLIPKCDGSREAIAIVEAMTHGLLPDGSPGLFRPCAETPSAPVQPK